MTQISWPRKVATSDDYDVTVADFSTIGYDALLLGRNFVIFIYRISTQVCGFTGSKVIC